MQIAEDSKKIFIADVPLTIHRVDKLMSVIKSNKNANRLHI